MLTRSFAGVLLATLLVVGTGCGGSDDSIGSSSSFVSFINASTSSPDLDIYAEDRLAVAGLAFGEGSNYARLDPGVRNVKAVPAGTLQVILQGDFELIAGAAYSLLLVDDFSSIEPLFLRDDRRPPAPNGTRFTFVHAAANLGSIDIYLTLPNIDIGTVEPLVQGIPFKGATGFGELISDLYRLRITTAGTQDLLYDSGSIPFPAGAILSLVVLDDPIGPVPIQVLAVDGGGTPSTVQYQDVRSLLRIVAASPDAPTFEVEIDGQSLAGGFDFLEVSEYLSFQAREERTISILNEQNGTVLAEITSPLDPSTFFTLTVSNSISNGLDPLLIVEDSELPAAGFGRIQIVHLAHTVGGNVDVYLVPFGTDITGRQPTVADVMYQDILGYFGREAGKNWEVVITNAGQKTVLASSGLIALGDQKIRTALFVEPFPYDVIVLEDN